MLRSLEMLWRFAISQSNNANGERMTEAQEQQLHIEGNFIIRTPSPSIVRRRSILFTKGLNALGTLHENYQLEG